ncbi:MAG: slipin family protein [Planctomycetes bacterium]|nr:slipin family protein [Planctomycetota bacterium]
MDTGTGVATEGKRVFAQHVGGHISLGWPLRGLLFVIAAGILGLVLFVILGLRTDPAIVTGVALAVVIGILVSGVRVAAQWERGVVLRLGKFRAVKGPGIVYIVPFIDYVRFVDMRILALNIPEQKVITKDNVPAEVDGVLFFFVSDAEKAVIKIEDYQFAISQYAQACLRDVVGGSSLDELLSERQQIQKQIGATVEERIKEWGLHVDSIRLLDIDMPEDLKRMMSRQASAEREKRATITKAEGDKLAAVNLSEAASIMAKSQGAMQLRTLQTIDGLGPTPSNTVVLLPVEWVSALKAIGEAWSKNAGTHQKT